VLDKQKQQNMECMLLVDIPRGDSWGLVHGIWTVCSICEDALVQC